MLTANQPRLSFVVVNFSGMVDMEDGSWGYSISNKLYKCHFKMQARYKPNIELV
jgi:hypothetical protein